MSGDDRDSGPFCKHWSEIGDHCKECALEWLGLSEADLQALADVRMLDEWVLAQTASAGHYTTRSQSRGIVAVLWNERSYEFTGPTPDAARHAAAEWVRGQR